MCMKMQVFFCPEILSTFEGRTPIPLHGKGGRAIEPVHPNYGFEMDLNDNI